MQAIGIQIKAQAEKAEVRHFRSSRKKLWRIVLLSSSAAAGVSFMAGDMISLITALGIAASTQLTAGLTVSLLLASFGFAFLVAHAMDKIENPNP